MADKLLKSLDFGTGDKYYPSTKWEYVEGKPTIPTKTSQLTNDSNFLTEHQSLDEYSKQSDLTNHNTSNDSHNDIRLLIEGLTTRLNALANSDDTTLDQMAEIVSYIKNNKTLIDGITTSKVNVSDIIDNLTTSVTNKPLSAKQGVALKGLIDTLTSSVNGKAPQDHTHSQYLTELPSHSHSEYATAAKVNELSEEIANLSNGVVQVPSYWTSELETKANDIQVAMEKAGRNKSSFLWYTDAHWVNGNAKVSPMLLNYLYKNTPINKVNFGGDIIGDSLLATRDEMKYLYEWRNAIRDLPNHHSVFGNHDMFASDSVNYEDDNYRYAFLLAPEESSDMVWGNGNYYYIDNPAEKTRYLYLAYLTGNHTAMVGQGNFIVDAIKSVEDGWHIVAIAHRWWQYSSSSTPTTGSIPQYETEILQIFDEYNARGKHTASNYFTAQDFSSGKGKVEFCIAGHIHIDYDIFSNGGIPIIITTADTNQNRVPTSNVDSGTVGTITESAVFGIIADYNEEVTKITVVGVGRGTSRVVRASTVKPTSITNISYSGDTTVESAIDKSKFAFTVNYSDSTTSQVNGASTVTPTTIATVGNNTVTITYVENGITLSATTTIVGTAKPIVNVFDKNDSDVLLTGRLNSSNNAVAYQEGQLVTGFIEAKIGNTFTIITDKSLKTNGYTGQCSTYNTGKTPIVAFTNANPTWSFSTDSLTGTITIPDSYGGKDNTATTYVRFCVAYTDIDSIVITKS